MFRPYVENVRYTGGMNEETEHADLAYEHGRRDMAHEFYAAVEDLLPDDTDSFDDFTPQLVRRVLVMRSSIEFHYENDPETLRINRFDAWNEGWIAKDAS